MADQNTASQAIPVRVLIVDTNGNPVPGGAFSAVTIANGGDFAEGSVGDTAWVSGDGTVIALLKKIASAGGSAVTIADGADVAEGALADAAIITDTTGTLSGKLRGLVKWAFERMPASLGQKVMASSLPVTLASDQASIPVAATLGAETTKVIGTVNQGTSPWVSNATLSAETTKVIGTVNVAAGQVIQANAGTNLNTSALALDATLTGRTQKSQITDGTRDGTVKAASTLPVATDTATVVTQRDGLPAGANVIGHVIVDAGAAVIGHTITDAGSVASATLVAETTKVIGTVRNIGNAGANFDAATGAAVPANGVLMGGTDGTNLRAPLTASAANLTTAIAAGALVGTPGLATWSITHRPAAATKATISKGAGAAGVRHVCTGFSFVLVTAGTAQAAVLNLDVIDGASGGTTRLWSGAFGGIPINSQVNIVVPICMLIGTAATAMTIEFSAAGAAASFSFVNLQGYDVS